MNKEKKRIFIVSYVLSTAEKGHGLPFFLYFKVSPGGGRGDVPALRDGEGKKQGCCTRKKRRISLLWNRRKGRENHNPHLETRKEEGKRVTLLIRDGGPVHLLGEREEESLLFHKKRKGSPASARLAPPGGERGKAPTTQPFSEERDCLLHRGKNLH